MEVYLIKKKKITQVYFFLKIGMQYKYTVINLWIHLNYILYFILLSSGLFP